MTTDDAGDRVVRLDDPRGVKWFLFAVLTASATVVSLTLPSPGAKWPIFAAQCLVIFLLVTILFIDSLFRTELRVSRAGGCVCVRRLLLSVTVHQRCSPLATIIAAQVEEDLLRDGANWRVVLATLAGNSVPLTPFVGGEARQRAAAAAVNEVLARTRGQRGLPPPRHEDDERSSVASQ